MLNLLKQPTIAEQQGFLREFSKTYSTPQSFNDFVYHCDSFKAKKSEKYIVQLKLNTHTPLMHVKENIHWAMNSLGGELQSVLLHEANKFETSK